jgi:signal peptidase I
MKQRKKLPEALWSLLDIGVTVAVAVGAVLFIRAFIVQPFLVSGKSMEPSFQDSDYLLIDELSYRFREPKRGEVVVFKHDASSFYIKRIMGLPGEHIAIRAGKFRVEGEDGIWFSLDEPYAKPSRTFGEFDVQLKNNEYYVLGDNRNFSFDSRRWGPLNEEKIVGLVRFRLWPLSEAKAIGLPSY